MTWRKPKMLRPLRRRDFALLWCGMTISLLGDGIYIVAIAWLVLRISNSPTALGIVGVAWTIPQVISLLWGGVASDRFDRRRVMIGADIARCIPIGIIGILSVTDTIELWHVFVLVAFYGAAEGFFMPAFSAMVPDVVPPDELVGANALDQFVRPLTLRFAGPALGGLIIAAVGVGTAFLIDAVSFIVSAVALAFIRARRKKEEREAGVTAWAEIREGLSYVRKHAWLWVTLLATAIGLLAFYGPFQVLVPFLIKNRLDGSAQDLGLVLAVGGVGAIVASLIMGERGLPKRSITFIYVCWAIGAFALGGYALSNSLWQATAVTFGLEFFLTAGLIVWTSLLQGRVPSKLLGRVSSLDWLVSSSLIPISYGLTGPLAESVGVRTTFVLAAVFGGLAVAAALLVPGVHAVEDQDSSRPVAV